MIFIIKLLRRQINLNIITRLGLIFIAIFLALMVTTIAKGEAIGQASQNETVTVTVTYPENVPINNPQEAKATTKEPGYEAGLAIAGLLAVAFLVLRQRK